MKIIENVQIISKCFVSELSGRSLSEIDSCLPLYPLGESVLYDCVGVHKIYTHYYWRLFCEWMKCLL